MLRKCKQNFGRTLVAVEKEINRETFGFAITLGFAIIESYFQHLRRGKCQSIMCQRYATMYKKKIVKTMELKFEWITPFFDVSLTSL